MDTALLPPSASVLVSTIKSLWKRSPSRPSELICGFRTVQQDSADSQSRRLPEAGAPPHRHRGKPMWTRRFRARWVGRKKRRQAQTFFSGRRTPGPAGRAHVPPRRRACRLSHSPVTPFEDRARELEANHPAFRPEGAGQVEQSPNGGGARARCHFRITRSAEPGSGHEKARTEPGLIENGCGGGGVSRRATSAAPRGGTPSARPCSYG